MMFYDRNLSFVEHGYERCLNASWNDIVLALESSKETTLANVIKTKLNIELSGDAFISCTKEARNQIQMSYIKEVYLLSEDIVVEELKQCHRSFTSLAANICFKLDELVKSEQSSLRHIAAFIQEA